MLMWLSPSSELEVTTGRIEAAHCGGRGAPQSYPQYPQAIVQAPLPPLLHTRLVAKKKSLACDHKTFCLVLPKRRCFSLPTLIVAASS